MAMADSSSPSTSARRSGGGRRRKGSGWHALLTVTPDPSADPFPSLPSSLQTRRIEERTELQRRQSWVESTFLGDVLEAFSGDEARASPAYLHSARTGQEQAKAMATMAVSPPLQPGMTIQPETRQGGGNPGAACEELQMHYSWADADLVRDVLEAFCGDTVRASAYLSSLHTPDMQEIADSASNTSSVGKEQSSCVGKIRAVASDLGQPNNSPLSSLHAGVPIEPEWQEDDVYLACRRDAIRMARARDRHAEGACKAYRMGDHSKAKLLSKIAQVEREEAEKLNIEAAEQIFLARNAGEKRRDIWELDLHGLHAGEAVSVLQSRLAEIETSISASTQEGSESILAKERERSLEGSLECRLSCMQLQQQSSKMPIHREISNIPPHVLPSHRKLSVITGIGAHSRGGASLPRAITNFLFTNGYKFLELRPGVIQIHPKLFNGKHVM